MRTTVVFAALLLLAAPVAARPPAAASSQWAAALDQLEGDDPQARAAAWALLADADAEVERVLDLLVGEPGPDRRRAWEALRRLDGDIARLAPRRGDPADSQLRARLVEGWRPLLETRVRELRDEALAGQGRALQRSWERGVKRLAKLVPAFRSDKGLRARARLLSTWEQARQEALRVIFDRSIYPDEDHGRAGQPVVDDAVDAVRSAWQPCAAAQAKDLRRLLGLAPQKAQVLFQQLCQARARLGELAAWSEAAAGAPAFPAGMSLLAERAGQPCPEAEPGAWEQVLLRHLDDEAVAAHNAAFARQAVSEGAQPTRAELAQVRITNDYRRMLGRAALRLDPRLVASARGHSEDMVSLDFFAHTSPVAGKERPADRMRAADYPAPGGENIAMGHGSPQAAHTGWYNSSGHHRNILGLDWQAMGSGQAGKYWTQNFGR